MTFVITRSSGSSDGPEAALPAEAVAYASPKGWRHAVRPVIELETLDELMAWMDALGWRADQDVAVVLWAGGGPYGYELPRIEIYDARRES